ncbi:RNA nucleotidyltransferase [Lujinxingia litoralis]|uniref:RNA nucleotidyltransferase n=1 Tax=Lujinxingia litoralis TaxID=2211119 RepID=A0A328C7T4_9DELT|nr:CCA tRNA nucleotidyltransferase [Lujinxingia litoralis]RAL22470.1 RNA nucleotidyltransferase [Lujinxingia litoralis]
MKRLFDAFEKAGKELYLVGGAVRDVALGIPMEELDDLDFCTNALPEESLAIIKAANLPYYEVGKEFGTIGAVLRGPESKGYPKDCQVTTYRSAEYYRRGSRHPVVTYGDTIDQDLGRRDFSINSMAMDAGGDFIDPYGGLDDLQAGVLRVVGDPWETLAEDPLRILRAARFQSRLGFAIDAKLRQASADRAECIEDISRERWLQEMTRVLRGAYIHKAMAFLEEVGLLGIILPEVAALRGFHQTSAVPHKDLWEHTLQVVSQCPQVDALNWAGLMHDVGKVWTREVDEETGRVSFYGHEAAGAERFEEVAQRFKMDRATAKEVRHIIEHHGRIPQYSGEWTDPAVRRLVRELDPYTESMLAFARADLTTASPQKRELALERVEALAERVEALEAAESLRPELPAGIGKVLMDAFNLKPSPQVGLLKSALEERIVEGLLESGREAEYYVESLRRDPPEEASEQD